MFDRLKGACLAVVKTWPRIFSVLAGIGVLLALFLDIREAREWWKPSDRQVLPAVGPAPISPPSLNESPVAQKPPSALPPEIPKKQRKPAIETVDFKLELCLHLVFEEPTFPLSSECDSLKDISARSIKDHSQIVATRVVSSSPRRLNVSAALLGPAKTFSYDVTVDGVHITDDLEKSGNYLRVARILRIAVGNHELRIGGSKGELYTARTVYFRAERDPFAVSSPTR